MASVSHVSSSKTSAKAGRHQHRVSPCRREHVLVAFNVAFSTFLKSATRQPNAVSHHDQPTVASTSPPIFARNTEFGAIETALNFILIFKS